MFSCSLKRNFSSKIGRFLFAVSFGYNRIELKEITISGIHVLMSFLDEFL